MGTKKALVMAACALVIAVLAVGVVLLATGSLLGNSTREVTPIPTITADDEGSTTSPNTGGSAYEMLLGR